MDHQRESEPDEQEIALVTQVGLGFETDPDAADPRDDEAFIRGNPDVNPER